MKPEGFRLVLSEQGQEGALLYLAQKVEELSARVSALDTRGQSTYQSDAPIVAEASTTPPPVQDGGGASVVKEEGK